MAYRLRRLDTLGPDPGERALRAIAFGEKHGIDLASAYSVLHGLMTVKDAVDIERQDRRERAAALEQRLSTGKRPNYDRGFEPAIVAGWLTLQQAIERGDRVQHASRLAQRHRLSMKRAFEVTDNRISLSQAKSLDKAAQVTVDPPEVSTSTGPIRLLVVGIVVLVAIGVGVHRSRSGDPESTAQRAAPVEEHVPPPELAAATRVSTDPTGRPTRISADNPMAAVAAIRHSFGPSRPGEALSIVSKTADEWTLQIRRGGIERTVTVRLEADSGRWIAGDGAGPIVADGKR